MSARNWVVQTAFLGDCILSLPFLQRLLENNPGTVELISGPAGESLFALALERGLAPHAQRVRLHSFEKRGRHRGAWGAWNFVRGLRRESGSPERVFCLQRSLRTAAMAWFSGAEERVGFSSGAASFLYTTAARREWSSHRSEIERNLDLLRSVYGEAAVAAWDAERAPSLLSTEPRKAPREPVVVVSVGSPWATKRWPVENNIELIGRLTSEGVGVKILGDAASAELAAAIQKKVPSLLLQNLAGKTSIRQWVDEIAAASLLVSADSAAVHAASDLRVPVVALFGPTLPDFGFAPWRRGSVALGVSQLLCRPCHIHGPQQCPLGHHKCMKDISGERVFKQVQALI